MGTNTRTAKPKHFGLIGASLKHSFSKTYFTEKFHALGLQSYSYKNFELKDEEALVNFIKKEAPNLSGFNVTIPYKESILPHIDTLDDPAKHIQAVNTVRVKDGKFIGYNTDVFGFLASLKPLATDDHKKALILGTGGASKAVAYALKTLKIDCLFVSRICHSEKCIAYKDIDKKVMNTCQIIINCTPVGMHPQSDKCPPIPYRFLTSKHLVYDLIYNPQETLFLQKAKQKGAVIQNGLRMLQLQAERAWAIWNL